MQKHKTIRLIGLACLLTAFASTSALTVVAAEKKEEKKSRGIPYAGTVSAIDKAAKTVTIKKTEATRTFDITPETKITKGGKPATIDDAVIGEEAAAYGHDQGSKHIAQSLRLGAKPETSTSAKKKKTDDKK